MTRNSILSTLLISLSSVCTSQSLIINRFDVASFDSIPEEFKVSASQFRMMFMDRSVGFNIHSYLNCLSEEWNNAPSYCKRYVHQDPAYSVDQSEVYWNGSWNNSDWHFRFWPEGCSEDVTCFIEFAENRLDSFDVIGCQFSYLAVNNGSLIADPVFGFFGNEGNGNKASTYAKFAAAHPDKKLIWWTTSLARGIGTPESESFNTQMRHYAADHEIILFDVADILSHDPQGNSCFDNRDGIAYKDENHPDDGIDIPAICPQYTTETEGGHLGSVSAGGVRVAKAFWVLMARLAGWKESMTSTQKPEIPGLMIYPNPTGGWIHLEFENGQLEKSAEYKILDVTGRIYRHDFLYTSSFKVEISDLTPGLYIIHVRMNHSWITKKIILKKS